MSQHYSPTENKHIAPKSCFSFLLDAPLFGSSVKDGLEQDYQLIFDSNKDLG